MSVPEDTGSGASPGLFVSLRSFWSVLLAILYTRLDLVTSELEDEGIRLLKLVIAGLISVLCLFMAYFWATFFLLALFWDTQYRLPVLGIIFGIYFIAGIGLLLVARNMILTRPKFLSQTIAELRRDVEGLRRAAAEKKDEASP
jgi:uncharacterized membrane protein YqjE